MQTLIKPKAKAKAKQTHAAPAEQSIGIRVCALSLVLLLVLASSSYVLTPPAYIFIYSLTAIGGSYMSYAFRNSRPKWVAILPTLGTILLFTNFICELYFAITATSVAPPAVAAFVHMLAGLLALHCFDLRSRTDFSISALIGLGLLTFLTGVARDLIFGAYVLIYTILAGALLFYDSSSRSHELGPSRAVAEAPVAGQPVIRRLRIASLAAMLPIFCIPLASVATCFILPKGDSVLELFVDGFRSQFPLSAAMSGQLSRGGRSQSVQGGAPNKTDGGPSYSAKGGTGNGSASSAGNPDPNGKGTGGTGGGSGTGGNGSGPNISGKDGAGKKGSAIPGLNGKRTTDIDPGDIKAQELLAKEAALEANYQNEMIDLKTAPSDLDTVVLKVGSQNPTYTRRYTLDTFDGNVWKRLLQVPSKELDPTPKTGFDLTAGSAVYVPPDLPTEEVTQEFRTEQSMGYILPNTWMPQIVKIEDDKIRLDGDGTIKLLSAMPEKTHYTVTSQVPVYDLEMMRRLPPETLSQLDEDREDELKAAQACLQLPPDLNPKIKDMGADAGGIEGNWFSKAERIAEYVKGHYHYSKGSFLEAQPGVVRPTSHEVFSGKSESTAAPNGGKSETTSDGFGSSTGVLDRAEMATKDPATTATEPNGTAKVKAKEKPLTELDHFLFERKMGNCRHFATAFTILCRTQGIPARIVVGFIPGELNKKTGYREVRAKDCHVWSEVYIPYWNWVPFDPIPDGQLPAHQEGGNMLSKFIASGLANPFGQTVSHRPKAAPANNLAGSQQKAGDKGNTPGLNLDGNKNKPKGSTFNLPFLGTIDQTQLQSVLKLIGVLAVLVCMTVALVIYSKQKKIAREQELLGDHPPSTLVFLEVLGELKRYDFVKQPTETADELSDRARYQFAQLVKDGRQIPRELPEVVSEFMELYSQERFGGADNLDDLHHLSERIKALSHAKAGK
jgi:transglutaminase-like putative cysteine protease